MRKVYHSGLPEKPPRVAVIVGPTASGKSALAVRLAKKFGGEVISADSRQVYRGLNIATGKITKREMRGIPHHLLDVADPKRPFTADDFVRLGRATIADIAARGKLPIVCGGTGFYVHALLGRISLPNVSPDRALRRRLKRKAATELFAILKRLDPLRARSIERQNPVRLIRAIEIARTLGRVPKSKDAALYRVVTIGIRPADAVLKRRIRARVAQRLRRGMIAEAVRLRRRGLSLARMRELGLEYRLLADYLAKKITKDELVRRIERKDQGYARRQLRWFKRDREIAWVRPGEAARAERSVRGLLTS